MINRHNLVTKIVALAFACGLAGTTASASLLDLGSSGSGFLGGAYFSTTNVQPTGTGVFNPFLSIQNSPNEQGYNSSIGNFDTKREPQWNHEIRFSDLQITTISGTAYFGFVVDINEPNGGGRSTISLDGLRIWTSSTLQSSTSTDASGRFNGSLGNLVFDLGANTLRYDDQQHGSGSGDINIFIPVSLFANAGPNDYVYMYQFWGNADFTQGGFEETAIRSGVVPIPEVSTFLPIVALLAAIGLTQKRRRQS
jgi:hypothetical protein